MEHKYYVIIIFITLVIILAAGFLSYPETEEVIVQNETVVLEEPQEEYLHVCLFKFSIDRQNYLKTFSYIFSRICEKEGVFDHIDKFLPDSYVIEFINNQGPEWEARYVGNKKIEINKKHWTNTMLAESVVHEMSYSATENLNLPPWLEEGIAIYTERRYQGTSVSLHKAYFKDLTLWKPSESSFGDNAKAYEHSGYVVKTLIEKYGNEVINDLLSEIKSGKGTLESLKIVTGNPELVIEDVLWP
jgi:hypothetical protein